jgi:short-subunit dehydrogenase
MKDSTFKKQYPNTLQQENKFNSIQSKRLKDSMSTLLILGANSDIAKAYARTWLNKTPNAKVILASRNIKELDEFIQNNNLKNCSSVSFDAADFQSHAAFYNTLPSKPTEVLYAAGVMFENATSIKNWKEAEAMIDVNYKGAVSIINIILADQSNSSLKRIAGISSLAGIRARKSNFMYGATKGAFMQYLQGLNQEYSDKGVVVQSINPGFVKTKMTAHLTLKEGLLQTPEEIAEVIYSNRKSAVVFTSFKWKIIALIIKFLPTFIIKKMQ